MEMHMFARLGVARMAGTGLLGQCGARARRLLAQGESLFGKRALTTSGGGGKEWEEWEKRRSSRVIGSGGQGESGVPRTSLGVSPEGWEKTAAYDTHLDLGGKMVEFAGYALPVQYLPGVKTEHLHTREAASLFDVSHMGQLRITGPDRVAFLESLVVADLQALEPNHCQLSVFTNENGGIIDDTVITNNNDEDVLMVVNGACKAKVWKHMSGHLERSGMNAKMEYLNRSLLALQGPKAAQALQRLTASELDPMSFMTSAVMDVDGIQCRVTRCGYTGEDGFEISCEEEHTGELMSALLDQVEVKTAGLGARDSLRLEAGLCLYGNDIDETTTPVEASLLWTIGKRRRAEAGFLGAQVILDQIKTKPLAKRVGLIIDGAPARENVCLFEESQTKQVGMVTSGTFSPCLSKPIAMGYVLNDYAKKGTKLFALVRKKMVPAAVAKMPFVPTRYYKP